MSDFVKKVHETMASNPGMAWTDAAKMVRGNAATPATPIAPVNPAVPTPVPPAESTPIQPTNAGYTNDSPFAGNIPAKAPTQPAQPVQPIHPAQPTQGPDTVTGVDGTVFRYTNNPDGTPRHATRASAEPVQSIKPVQAVDYNVGAGREQEIVNNIADGIKNDARVQEAINTGNQEAFRRIYGYETADDTKKRLIDDQFSVSFGKDAESLFRGLVNGRMYAEAVRNTPEYQEANLRATKYKQYSFYGVNELAKAIKSGEILPGTQTYNDLINTPEIAEKIKRARDLRFGFGDLDLTSIEKRSNDEIKSLTPTTQSIFADGIITAEEYAEMTETPEIREKQKDVENKKNRYDTLKRQWDAIEEDIDNDARFSRLSASGRRALIADRQKGMKTEMLIAMDEYHNAVGTLTEMRKNSATLFEANMTMYRDNLNFERQKEMSRYNAEMDLKKSEAEFEMKLNQQDRMMNDPRFAIPEMLKEFAEKGVTTQRSQQAIIEEAKQYVANGGNLGDYMSQLRGLMQSKPEYKRYMEIQNGKLSDMEQLRMNQAFQREMNNTNFSQSVALANMNNNLNRSNTLFEYDLKNETEKKKFLQDATMNGIAPEAANAYLKYTEKGGVAGIIEECRVTGQCGAGVNDYTQRLGLGKMMGDSYASKKQHINSSVPVVGGLAVWNPGGGIKKYGHVGIVTAVNNDGTVTIRDWNWKGDEKQGTHNVSIDIIKSRDGGFVDLFGGITSGGQSQTIMPASIKDVILSQKSTEGSRKAIGFGIRMDEADRIMTNLENEFMTKGINGQMWDTYVPNVLKGPNVQKMEQAQRNFINAVLRRESGAQISDSEFANARLQYFPVIGDTPEVIEQKRRTREDAINSMMIESGLDENGIPITQIWRNTRNTDPVIQEDGILLRIIQGLENLLPR